jgi:hypothetical protein
MKKGLREVGRFKSVRLLYIIIAIMYFSLADFADDTDFYYLSEQKMVLKLSS